MAELPEIEEAGPMEVTVLGKVIGTVSGWDQADTWAVNFYDFEPNNLGLKFLKVQTLEEHSLYIDFENGTVTLYPAKGDLSDDGSLTGGELDVKADWSVFNETE